MSLSVRFETFLERLHFSSKTLFYNKHGSKNRTGLNLDFFKSQRIIPPKIRLNMKTQGPPTYANLLSHDFLQFKTGLIA